MKFTKILLLLTLVFAITGCAGKTATTPTPDHLKDLKDNVKQKQQETQAENASATNEWLTYINSYYQYSIQYPNDWFVDTKYSESPFTQRGPVEDNTFIGGDTIWSNYQNTDQYTPGTAPDDLQQIFLHIYKTEPQTILSAYIDEMNYSYIDFEEITINGLEAMILNGTGEGVGPNPVKMYLIKSGDKIFKFSHGLNQVEAQAILNQMVNTFTFN